MFWNRLDLIPLGIVSLARTRPPDRAAVSGMASRKRGAWLFDGREVPYIEPIVAVFSKGGASRYPLVLVEAGGQVRENLRNRPDFPH
jgi:hypothetical protein